MTKLNSIKTINIVIWSLGILAILAMSIFLVPKEAQAAVNYVGDSSVNVTNNFTSSPSSNQNTLTYNPTYYQSSAPIYSYNTNYIPAQTYTPAQTTTVSYVDTPTIYSKTSVAKANTANKMATVAKADTTITKDLYNGLAANAVFGENGFLPSGLLQWILFAIIILIAIILARRVFGRKDKYHQAPLKHA